MDKLILKSEEMRAEAGQEYSVVNDAEHCPEVCNEFVTVYLRDKKHFALQKTDAIDLTRNFCHWLFDRGYSCSRISIL